MCGLRAGDKVGSEESLNRETSPNGPFRPIGHRAQLYDNGLEGLSRSPRARLMLRALQSRFSFGRYKDDQLTNPQRVFHIRLGSACPAHVSNVHIRTAMASVIGLIASCLAILQAIQEINKFGRRNLHMDASAKQELGPLLVSLQHMKG
jgi:hypothetical protein